MRTYMTIAIVPLCFFGAASSGAAATNDARPAIFQNLVDCRAQQDAALRLVCYDTQVAALDDAETKKELVVVDKAQMKQARKSLFGFSIPKIALFGGGDDDQDEDELRVLETTVSGARQMNDGNWRFQLADGVYWRQMEAKDIFPPKSGDKIKIRRASMGSYLASINGRSAFRVKREN